jgi:multidrug efflux pump subunit AcrB
MLTILCLLAGAVCEIQKDNASARIPVIVVSASYPGANASVVADTVAAVLEQQINGVEGSVRIESDSPLGDVADLKEVIGPSAIYRVNLHRALRITCPDAVANAKKLAEAELTAQRREKFELLDLTAR